MNNRFPSLSVVMMAYNEEACLPDATAQTIAFLRERVEDPELVVVNDGSSDTTGAQIDALAEEVSWVRACHHPTNRGIGGSLKTGFSAVTKAWAVIMPADGQIDPYQISRLLEQSAGTELVLSNYRDRAEQSSLHRRTLTLGFHLATLLLVQTTIKGESIYLVRRSLLERLLPRLRSETFFFNIELPIRAERAGVRPRAVKIDYFPRAAGASKVTGPGRILRTAAELLKLRLNLWREGRDDVS